MDVQRGSEADTNNPARLEFEILGIGAGYRTWSILYKRIEGNIGDPYSGAWEELHQWALENKLTFYRSDGFGFPVSLFFIDSGSGGEEMDIIYRFCSRWQNTFPIKGFQSLKRRKTEKGDEITEGNFRRYRAAKMAEGVTLYEISTNYYKTQIYNNLKISRQEIEPQRPGFCDFPSDYGERYFEMLTAEERHRDGSFHAGGRRNEALDCRVYALCAADVFLDSLLLDFRSYAKQNGARQDQIQQITHVTVIDDMKRQTIRKKI
jgi:phage terminase large subunit GpA-like protein